MIDTKEVASYEMKDMTTIHVHEKSQVPYRYSETSLVKDSICLPPIIRGYPVH